MRFSCIDEASSTCFEEAYCQEMKREVINMKTEQENGDYDDTVSHSRSEYTETEYEEYKRFYKNDTLALYTIFYTKVVYKKVSPLRAKSAAKKRKSER